MKKSPPATTITIDKLTLAESKTLFSAYMQTGVALEKITAARMAYVHQFTAATPGELFRFAQYN